MAEHIHKPKDTVGDRYRVVRFAGSGGMQEVYEAVDLAFNRTVALKVPKNPSAKKRFARSAEMSARVTHPNVARTLDYMAIGETFYLVEEFVNGVDLQVRLNTEFQYFDPHLAAHMIHHLAKGVAACHHADVFHRDLKPSNVMVSKDASFRLIKLTDFGIAKMAEAEIDEVMEDATEESITGSQTVVGALPFMAPELISAPREATKAADVWSLGAILFYLLFGEKPFGAGGLKVVARILNEDLPPLASVVKLKGKQFDPLVSELWSIVETCMRKDAGQRPTADGLVEILSKVCYSTAERQVGTIYNYHINRADWGFIGTPSGENYFFHKDSYYGEAPADGLKVIFAPFEGRPRARAFPVLPLKN